MVLLRDGFGFGIACSLARHGDNIIITFTYMSNPMTYAHSIPIEFLDIFLLEMSVGGQCNLMVVTLFVKYERFVDVWDNK